MKANSPIPFYRPYVSGKEEQLLQEAIEDKYLAGPGRFSKACEAFLRERMNADEVLLTPSCSHALEMAVILCGIGPDDEVIMPSFTFVSTANAVVLRGATPVFVDINPGDMNVAPEAIRRAITEKTRAILVMHYAGFACDMDAIMAIAKDHNLFVIEDAAHCIGAHYKGQALGTIGDFGTLSFHQTKNIQCGEGGALVMRDGKWSDRANQIREKGTNRKAFQERQVSFYEWTDIGSSFLLGELPAAF